MSIINFDPKSNIETTEGSSQEFSITTNQSCDVTWYLNDVIVKSDSSVSFSSYVNSGVSTGTHDVRASASNSNGTVQQSWTWKVSQAEEMPVPEELGFTDIFPSCTNLESQIGDVQTFRIATDKICNFKWYLNGVEVQLQNEQNGDSYVNGIAPIGVNNVTVVAENVSYSQLISHEWTWQVLPISFNVDENPVVGTIQMSEGGFQTFSVTSTDVPINVSWFVDGNEIQANEAVTTASFTFEGTDVGAHTITASISGPDETYLSIQKVWNLEVFSKFFFTGSLVWDENFGLSTTYTWNALSYSGFCYDLDTGVYSEELTISDIGRSIDEGNIEYVTCPIETDFEYINWGSYQSMGFTGDEYFIGYMGDETVPVGEDVSLLHEGILAKILVDSEEEELMFLNSPILLGEGYILNLKDVDIEGNKAWIELKKDGELVDDEIVCINDDFIYEADFGVVTDIPQIIVHFCNISNVPEKFAVVNGTFQISGSYLEIHPGDSFEQMEITSISSSHIKMENEDDVSLIEGEIIDLMGKIQLQVANDNVLRFAPLLNTSEPGTYELRGTVFDENVGATLPTWTPFNFEGFYYNIDEGTGTEELRIEELNGREIPVGKLIYFSIPKLVEFEHKEWGEFQVIGLMAEKYFAGYPEDAVNGEVDDVSLLSNNILSKVLVDSDDKESMYSGSALILEENYTLNVVEVDLENETAWIQLEKDEAVVDGAFISSNEDYIFETNLGAVENVPLIIVHTGEIFAGSMTNGVFVDGLFQISEDYIEIKAGDSFGEMEVTSIGSSGIVMENEDDINLYEGGTIDIVNNIKFKVSDSSTLRFYPFVEIIVEQKESPSPSPSDKTYTMSLKKGWNLVSTPLIPDNPDVNSIFGSNEDVILPVYTWRTENRQYYDVSTIDIGHGYWVLALEDTEVTFSGTPYNG